MKLHNLINPELGIKIEGSKVTLEEKQKEECTLKEVIINQIPDNVFIFNMDKETIKEYKNNSNYEIKQCMNQFLDNKRKRINKRCDYIVFYYENNELYLFFCELKSTKPNPSQYETQLVNTKLFINYLLTLFNQYYENIKIKQSTCILFHLIECRDIQRSKQSKQPKRRETSGNTTEYRLRLKIEQMKNYSNETIVKKSFLKPIHNNISWNDFIEWKDLAANFNPN